MKNWVVLVSCGAAKLTTPAPARSLYTGSVFRAQRDYAEAIPGRRWAILSALYGLVDPDTVIAPYDLRLTNLSRADRRKWAEKVAAQIDNAWPTDPIIFTGGRAYRTAVAHRSHWCPWDDLDDARFGYQISWLQKETRRVAM